MDLPTPSEILALRGKRKSWKWIVIFAGLALGLFAWEQVDSSQSLTFRERKKSVDSKVRILREMRRSFHSVELEKDLERVESYSSDLESMTRAGTAQERSDALSTLERKLPEVLKRWSEFAENFSSKLLQYAVRETQLLKIDSPDRHHLTAKENALANNYFRMAREEWISGNKFHRDGNYLYALILYKRSLKYSLSCLKTSKLPVPEEFQNAGERPLDKINR
ncbi:hypothetical protein LEP1GSC050_0625 [Leptospira broomii serovar Hurstbridge str. 5399]|uniref:PROCN domain protein n=1 Tax=Leptospira broomii serovar Hurstbridge str. 5399 TaxID=1049789 RepID=T0GK31_9LEPT|nr:hypothetical protein [Leptospira broomii]EQA47119.1 hypothetical protein LEP1GSC050_0625 [Leptospira broomii serovar Hurstbridge str. 5399]